MQVRGCQTVPTVYTSVQCATILDQFKRVNASVLDPDKAARHASEMAWMVVRQLGRQVKVAGTRAVHGASFIMSIGARLVWPKDEPHHDASTPAVTVPPHWPHPLFLCNVPDKSSDDLRAQR